jgi:omega-hydroxy-beta-dihydromenaquinone-9 sulfotransferase
MRRVQEVKNRWSTDQLITGIEVQDWVKLLRDNGWQVDPTYLHRAAWITGWSLPSTVLGRLEDATYGRKLAAMDVNPTPIFILGHWRSGTTHLHNLLGRDPNHTYSTVYQVVFPSSFLIGEKFIPQLTGRFLTETRTYDNVKHGWHEAAEDEIALAKLTGLSPYISFMFPDNASKYEQYIDFLECTDDERQRWKDGLTYLIKKIMLATGGKRVIVKSCTHSARIRLLLEMFPDAKFIHIHRNPYEVFASTLHMRSHTDWENFFHLPDEHWEEYHRREQTALMGERIFTRLLEDRSLIPEQNYFELAYDDLVGNELEVMKSIYTQFQLPDWDQYHATISDYLDSIKGYKRNRLDIDEEFKDFVYDRWRVCFDTYGYPKEYEP